MAVIDAGTRVELLDNAHSAIENPEVDHCQYFTF